MDQNILLLQYIFPIIDIKVDWNDNKLVSVCTSVSPVPTSYKIYLRVNKAWLNNKHQLIQ